VAIGNAPIQATYQSKSASQTVVIQDALPGLACGVERWPVKTLSDPDATTIDVSRAQTVSIKDLNLLAAHCGSLPDARTYAPEFQVYETTGKIVVVRTEDDRDYHMALADLAEPNYTIVTESPDPACGGAVRSPLRQTLIAARSAFDSIIGGRSFSSLVGTTIRVRGVGFYDFNHGQTGRSESCLELHPIVAMERIQ
jgi:hypothetical protein